MDYTYTAHAILQARILEWVGDLPNPGIELRSPALQADSLPAELSGESTCALLHSTLGIIILFIYAHLAFFQTSPFSKHTLLSGKLLWENLD